VKIRKNREIHEKSMILRGFGTLDTVLTIFDFSSIFSFQNFFQAENFSSNFFLSQNFHIYLFFAKHDLWKVLFTIGHPNLRYFMWITGISPILSDSDSYPHKYRFMYNKTPINDLKTKIMWF